MNLKRVRIDPDGLIVQSQTGSLRRIPLPVSEINRLVSDSARLRRYVPSVFTDDGALDARLDVDLTETDCLNRPLRIYYGIEPRCDLACRFCGPRDFHDGLQPMDAGFEGMLLEDFAAAGAFQVQLTGGEIGIRGLDLVKTVRKAADLGLAIILGTNGVWQCVPDKDLLVRELALCGNVIQSKISIEGTPEFHESIRGKGTYGPAIDTLAKLAQHGLNPRINTTVFNSSCDSIQLKHLVGLAKRYRCGLQPIPERPTGRAAGTIDQMPSREKLREYTKLATLLRQEAGVPISFNFDIFDRDSQVPIYDLRNPVSCGAPLMGLHVTHTGECYPCGFAQEFPELMTGKVGQGHTYLEIWRTNDLLKKIRKAGKSAECNACKHYGKGCWGGCWVMAYTFSRSVSGMDPYCLKRP